MPFYTGRTGKLFVGTAQVAKVRNWTLDTSVSMLDTTALGDSANSFVPGLFSATGSATLSYYNDASGTDVTELLAKINKTTAVTENDRVNLTFDVGTNQSFQADAYINSASITSSTDELTTVSFNFTIDGPLDAVVMTGTT